MKTIHPGDIIFFRGKSFISRGIRWFTDSEWSHVGMALNGTELIEATAAGVEKNKIEPLIKNAEKICIKRIPDLTVEEMETIKTKAYACLYENYDFLQFISLIPYFLFRKLGFNWTFLIFNSRTKMICSELVGVLLWTVDRKLAKTISKLKKITPQDVYDSNIGIVVFEGTYSELLKYEQNYENK